MVLNTGLETLGTDEYFEENGMYFGVFQRSAVKNVYLSSTLRKIEYNAFMGCKFLKNIKFPDQLEKIGLYAFGESAIENVTTPQSVRVICQGAFFDCRDLKKVILNEGLEVLGTDEYPGKGSVHSGVFEKSVLQIVLLPRTLRRIEYNTFCCCQNLKGIRLPDTLEIIGNMCFARSGIEKISLPARVKEVGANAFYDCK